MFSAFKVQIRQCPVTYSLFLMILWIFVARQRGIQYSLHATLPVITGMAMLFHTILVSPGIRRALWLGLSGAILAVNFIFGLTTIPVPIPYRLLPLFSVQHGPLIREDYNEVVRLVDYLRSISSPGDAIYVVDSSEAMNFDLLVKAEESLYGRGARSLDVFITPQVDSRDYYPLEQLLQAKFLILTTPFQHHLDPEEQRVVKFVYSVFTENWEIAQDFTRLPNEFHLNKGLILSVYQRERETSLEDALNAFRAMQPYIGEIPGGQPEWLLLSQPGQAHLYREMNDKRTVSITIPERPYSSPVRLLYAGGVSASGEVSGTMDFQHDACPNAIVSLTTSNEAGNRQRISSQEIPFSESSINFSLPFQAFPSDLLLFEVSQVEPGEAQGGCSISLRMQLMKE